MKRGSGKPVRSRCVCEAGIHRSSLECRSAAILGDNWSYEAISLPYVTRHTYTPDFIDVATKTIRECKGFFDPASRSIMRAIKATYPDWKIIMVFQNPSLKISKRSKTTYAQWCEKHGIEWETAK